MPGDLTVTATADDGTIQAVADEANQVYGVQFHPESIMTDAEVGKQIIKKLFGSDSHCNGAGKACMKLNLGKSVDNIFIKF